MMACQLLDVECDFLTDRQPALLSWAGRDRTRRFSYARLTVLRRPPRGGNATGNRERNAMHLRDFRKAGHWPTLLSAFLYFDVSFMVWVLLGGLGNSIALELGL